MLIRWPEVFRRGRHMRKELKVREVKRISGWRTFQAEGRATAVALKLSQAVWFREQWGEQCNCRQKRRVEDDITEVRLGGPCKPINKFGIYYTFPRRFCSPWSNLIQILEGPLCLLCKKRLVVGQKLKEGISIWITEILKQKMIVSGWESCGYKWWTKDEFWGQNQQDFWQIEYGVQEKENKDDCTVGCCYFEQFILCGTISKWEGKPWNHLFCNQCNISIVFVGIVINLKIHFSSIHI